MCDPAQIRHSLIPQMRDFDQMFTGKVFPIFEDPEKQADAVAEKYWQEQMAMPVVDDSDVDASEVAEDAEARGEAYYLTLASMHTTVLNLFAAGLHHLFEQQSGELFRTYTGTNVAASVTDLREHLKDSCGIDIETAPGWSRLEELRLVANVVKHAEGRSAEDLRAVNPDYFREPMLRQPEFAGIPSSDRQVGTPLAGEDIYVTKDDYDGFVTAVTEFWDWLASGLEARHP